VLYLQANSTAGGFELHEMLRELRILIIFSETDLGCSLASIDEALHLVAPKSGNAYLMDASALASRRFWR
jgi:hypothetical protein